MKNALQIIFALALLTLAGCSSNKPVASYEGELPPDQVAVLEVPASVNIIAINGTRMPSYLLEDLAVNYGLKAGKNTVKYEFATLWATTKIGDEKNSELVKSNQSSLVFTAQPGARYKITAPEPENLREAKSVAASFKAEVLDADLSVVSRMVVEEAESPAAKDAPEYSLEQLKLIWVQLGAEDKQSFLKWALQ